MPKSSKRLQSYFKELQTKTKRYLKIAQQARQLGFDPSTDVEIQLANDAAERVVGLISVISPNIKDSNIPKRIKELEKIHGTLNWKVACEIALEVAQEKFYKFESKKEAIETGIRVGFAYVTLGVVSSPLEGFTRIEINKTNNNEEYFSMFFSGPIRNAGGTAASVSVIIADYVRKNLNYSKYQPTEEEIERSTLEVLEYNDRVANLQYLPTPKELRFLIKNLPIQINGDPTERIEVSNYKDLKNIYTNRIRGGVCLVLSECLSLKAPKLYNQLKDWDNNEDWIFLEEFIKIQKEHTSKQKLDDKILPNYTYIKDTVGGRPILCHPMKEGGFRLRYGRSRTSGFSAQSIHPATMIILDDFIAIGTQVKVERPGKAASYTSCDSIEPPIVKLKDNSVVKIKSVDQAKKIKDEIKSILFLGDVLINYGDFYDRAQRLPRPGYCEEWWRLETKNKDPKNYEEAKKLDGPMYPEYTHYWSLGNISSIKFLHEQIQNTKLENNKLILKYDIKIKRVLENIGCEHEAINKENIIIKNNEAIILKDIFTDNKSTSNNSLNYINDISPYQIKDKAGTFVGSKMGRPEKAKIRRMKSGPHGLFPTGEQGGRQNLITEAYKQREIISDVSVYYCENCKKQLSSGICYICNKKVDKKYVSINGEYTDKKEDNITHRKQKIDIKKLFDKSLEWLDLEEYPEVIKGLKELNNPNRQPEHLIKAILRAKHNLSVNKDGTIRYDASEIPITHFKPKETATSIEKLIELGYEKDIENKPLENENQILELLPQDVILPSCTESPDRPADDIFLNIAEFLNELLKTAYKQKKAYKTKSRDDLIGHLIVGLAPHTSAGIIGRIIGFSKTQGYFAHPYFHAAMRRDCDGDESSMILLMDAFLNFSKEYLPDRRGSTMDAPLVLTTVLDPNEVDDMVFNIDRVFEYPLEFYQAAENEQNPWEVKIELINDVLNTDAQYEGMGFTHDTNDINEGVLCSSYKTIPSMQEKMKGQMELAEKIKAVDESDVARIVIETHFLKDTKGNLRRYSQQQFRCTSCNTKYRRPNLNGRCKCGGKIIFTVTKGSVLKYLQPSLDLAKKYKLSTYLSQTLELLKLQTESIFGKKEETQVILK